MLFAFERRKKCERRGKRKGRQRGQGRTEQGRVSKAGIGDSAGWKGRADTQSSCSVDNQTLYCLRYIRRNTVKIPLGNKETADS